MVCDRDTRRFVLVTAAREARDGRKEEIFAQTRQMFPDSGRVRVSRKPTPPARAAYPPRFSFELSALAHTPGGGGRLLTPRCLLFCFCRCPVSSCPLRPSVPRQVHPVLPLDRLLRRRDEPAAAARVMPGLPRADRERRRGRVCAGPRPFVFSFAGAAMSCHVFCLALNRG